MKREWESKLNENINLLEPRESISNSIFVDVLSDICYKSLSLKNIVSGFRATGILPLNCEKYPQDLFKARLLKRYENCAKLGKPEDIMEDLSIVFVTPIKEKFPELKTARSVTEDQNDSECITGPSSQLEGTLLLSIYKKKNITSDGRIYTSTTEVSVLLLRI